MNSFGKIFKISIFGESHGSKIGVTIDGCPPGIGINHDDFTHDINRRKPGKKGTTSRIESDLPNIVSGVFEGKSTGTPITILFDNNNTRSKDYAFVKHTPRPGHADFVSDIKYKGFQDYRGGGHFSGRLTLGLVAAGTIAKKIISPIDISSEILEVGGKTNIEEAVKEAQATKDSVGGIIQCSANNVPVGLGEPFFDSVESYISHLVFSIPGIKGIEFGLGFESAAKKGSEVNDAIIAKNGKTGSNNSGGINGGISNGNTLMFRVAIKPTPSIGKSQKTFNFDTNKIESLQIKGRHDTCIALRMPVIIEAATAIAIADLHLQSLALNRI